MEQCYRESLSRALLDHVTSGRGLALCPHDMNTLYFKAEREDDLRRVRCSKERKLAPRSSPGY